jgi:hypothetical protein
MTMIYATLFLLSCGEDADIGKPDILPTADSDGDGYDVTLDCNDSSSAIHPGADEICDGVDQDCDGEIDENPIEGEVYFVDSDGDGAGFGEGETFCEQPLEGYAPNNHDCNDEDGSIHRDAEEICDGIDNDCDEQIDEDVKITFYVDVDGDGYGADVSLQEECEAPALAVSQGGDCDDSDPNIYPSAAELCDGIDNDCNGLSDSEEDATNQPKRFADQDGDGFGDSNTYTQDCSAEGWIDNNEDCDDSNADINPSIQEICDDIDNNCDSLIDDDDPTTSDASKTTFYLDTDGDGYGIPSVTMLKCDQPTGYSEEDTDCDDSDIDLSPATPEICNDAINNNCDSLIDCDDPICGTDALCVDIDCSDGIDSDGDGFTDCRDSDCIGSVDCGESCLAEADEDNDGFFECNDSECFFVGECANSNCPQITLGSEKGSNVSTGNNTDMNNNVDGDCYASGASGNDVSFLWTAPASGCVTFDTIGTTYDAVISIYDSCSDMTSGSPIGCDDGTISSGDAIACHTMANQEFYVVIDGYNDSHIGDYSLNIDMVENISCNFFSACQPQ